MVKALMDEKEEMETRNILMEIKPLLIEFGDILHVELLD